MKLRRAYYLWFAATLIFGLVAGSVLTTSMAAPSSAVPRVGPGSGPIGTLTGCLGATPSSTGLTLGGRVVTPSTILRISPTGACAGNEANLNVFSYANTVLVSAGANTQANGANLQATLSAVAALGPNASKTFLLKLEPGVYDLGSTPLQLVPYVQIEGSGEGATRLSGAGQSTGNTGIISATNNTELRELSVESLAGNTYSTGIYVGPTIDNSFKVSHVTLLVAGGSSNGTAIFNNGGAPIIENATMNVSNTTANGFSYGVSNNGNAAQIKNSRIQTQTTGTGQAIGVYNFGGATTLIKDDLINVSSSGVPTNTGSPDAIGVSNNFGAPLVQNTNIAATTTGGGSSLGLVLNNYTAITATTTIEGGNITANSSGASFVQGILNNTAGGNPAALVVRNTAISVSGVNKANCQVFGINSFGAPSALYNSNINVSIGTGCLASVGLILQGSGSPIIFNNGYIKSTNYGLYNSSANNKIEVGASQLDAPITSSGAAVCVSSFKGDYTATTATCG